MFGAVCLYFFVLSVVLFLMLFVFVLCFFVVVCVVSVGFLSCLFLFSQWLAKPSCPAKTRG